MNQREFELIAPTGAIENVVISGLFNPSRQSIDWSVWAYGNAVSDNALRTSRGGLKVFRNLQTAYLWVRGCGFGGKVYVENV